MFYVLCLHILQRDVVQPSLVVVSKFGFPAVEAWNVMVSERERGGGERGRKRERERFCVLCFLSCSLWVRRLLPTT